MVPDASVVHERVLWAVNTVVEQCWGQDPDTVARALNEAFVADELLSAQSVAFVIDAYLPTTANLVFHYLSSFEAAGARPAEDPVAGELNETLSTLAHDVATTYAVVSASYESPSLNGPVSDMAPVFQEQPSVAQEAERPIRDGEPGSAARRKTGRAERALKTAQRTLADLDWSQINDENAQLLKNLKVGERRMILWVKTRGIIVVGKHNSAFDTVNSVRKVDGIGIFPGFLQLTGKSKLLSQTRQATLTNIPPDEAEEVRPLLSAYRIDVSLASASRWAG
ncbi:hypothetical protein [Streptomyces sp. NPDC051014]|uniref:hypothetical protein n=1 Tax=Streptomyces sp. NPDC051014 TaxID=3155751 RepID=UPI0033D98F59